MLYLFLAILSSAGVSVVMRFSVNSVKNNITMLSAGYLSCTVLSILHGTHSCVDLEGTHCLPTILLGLIGGSLLLAGFVFLQFNIKINGLVLPAIFAKLGVIVPTFLSVFFFKEQPRLIQIIGFLLALFAIILIHSDQETSKTTSIAALLLLLLSNGFADSMAKFFDEFGDQNLEEFYFIFTFAVAFLLSMILALFKKQGITLADIFYGLLLGIPNYYSIRFLTKAVMEIPAFITYPTYSVATIVLISVIGMIFFKEKLRKNQKYGLTVILLALVLLNM